MKKVSYPENTWKTIAQPHNITTWTHAFQEILNRSTVVGKTQAIKEITANWEIDDRDDFLTWMKFYEGLNHLKYKKAQQYVPNLLSTIPGSDSIANPTPKVVDEQKAIQLANHRKKIISRLDSLEKLVRSDESSGFSKEEMTGLIKNIHDLKSKFYTLKLASIKTYDDIVAQHSNKLLSQGFKKSANMLFLVQASGAQAGIPAASPTQNESNATPANNTQQGPMEPAQIPLADAPMSLGDQKPEELELDSSDSDDEVIKIEAQELPAPAIEPPAAPEESVLDLESNPSAETPLVAPVATPAEKDTVHELSSNRDIDDMIEDAFGDVTPEMIMKKLEEVSRIFKTKEIPRQLAIVDFMLDKLGMATFFPQLSEASGKAIESSNYISTRIDEVLNYLRGTVKGNGIDLVNGEGNTQAIIQKLQQKEDADTLKQQNKLTAQPVLPPVEKETPVIEIDSPVALEATTPATVPSTPQANQPAPLV